MRCLLILLLGLVWQPVTAGIYRWVDGSGEVHFGDAPPRRTEAQRLEPRINSYQPVLRAPLSAEPGVPSRSTRVVMYSTRWCGYCKQARAYFRKAGIRFTEHDIEHSSSARLAYDRLGGRGVPLILVGDQRMSGFSVARFKRLYNR